MTPSVENKETIYFKFLEDLRESGKTNMFGAVNAPSAAAYLEREFGLDKYDAKDVLLAWMKSHK